MIAQIRSRCSQTCGRVTQRLRQLDEYASRRQMILLWSFAIAFKFILDALYIWVASPLYAYAGLIYVPSFLKYVLATGMYFIIFAYLPKNERSTAAILLHIQFVYTVAPMLTFYSMANGSNKYMLMVFLCILLEIFIVRKNSKKQNPVYLTGVKNYITVAVGVLLLVAVVIPPLYNGFAGLKVFDFEYIYEMRANATYPPGFTYLFFWMGKAIIPFFVVYLLDKKRYGWMSAAIAVQLLLYMECGNKFLLFILVPVIAVYFCAKSGHMLKLLYAGLGLFLLALIPAYLLDRAGGHSLGVQGSFYVAVRAIFHPADNKFAMFECFSQYPQMHFSQGMIGKLLGLTNLYNGSEGQIIYAFNGGLYKSVNLNTGYLGEAYAQMGFVGMVMMSGLFGLILRAVESYNSRKTFCVLTAVFAMFMINLNDISLLTTLLSSGMFIVLILIAAYIRKEPKDLRHGI